MRSPARADGIAAAWSRPRSVRTGPGTSVPSAPLTLSIVWPCRISSRRIRFSLRWREQGKTLNVGDREHSVAFLFEEHCHAVVFDAHDDADAPGLVLDVGIEGERRRGFRRG